VHKLCLTEKQRKQKVMELLEKTGLKPGHYYRYPHEFSGGQRQRIVIARALALEPGFIVCDESVSALDVSVQAQILNLLNDLKAAFGFTAIFISHDLSVIRYMSDRIAVMHNGMIEEMGITENIYNNPQSEYTKKLIASMPVVTG
jgi:peptide/nickel transport system ATP-binding protein